MIIEKYILTENDVTKSIYFNVAMELSISDIYFAIIIIESLSDNVQIEQ